MYVREIYRNDVPLEAEDAYLSRIPAIAALQTLRLESPVTFLIGENGAGKSTLLEAAAVAFGFNPEGGTRNFNFSTQNTHSGLHRYITLVKEPRRARDGFFLRAESFYNAASYIDELAREDDPSYLDQYGGRSLHAQSHGESFLSLVMNRFGGHGFYVLDEPEAALSPSRQLALLCRIHDLVQEDSQFLIATHSPILMAYPDAELYLLNEKGIQKTAYKETEHYQITRSFLENPQRMLEIMLT
ncbi:MAG: AAA family ATPase [Eubacteriales bacterium]|nr:AAA family ATPase [Eubacteriales bacterium]